MTGIVGVLGKIDTTRGDAKVKVDDIMAPGALPQRPAQAVHVRLRDEVGSRGEPPRDAGVPSGPQGELFALFPRRGRGSGDGETVVQASSQIRVADSEELIAGLRQYAQVADVWTE